MPLGPYARSIHSQHGEDGILEEILHRISVVHPLDRWCVELGAWDGVHLSNTCHLIRSRSYSAVLIEADPARYRELRQNHPDSRVLALLRRVELDGPNRLGSVLAETPLPADFDVLSIDIDGADYWVFRSLQRFRPKVVIIEFNPTIPNAVHFVQARDLTVHQGSSARALVTLARRKGYALVAATPCNLILVDRTYASAVLGSAPEPELADVRDDRRSVVLAFSGFDGSIHLSRPLGLPWHGVRVPADGLATLPRVFRGHPADWGRVRRWLWLRLRDRRYPPTAR